MFKAAYVSECSDALFTLRCTRPGRLVYLYMKPKFANGMYYYSQDVIEAQYPLEWIAGSISGGGKNNFGRQRGSVA